jgi:curved DNA-binding protein
LEYKDYYATLGVPRTASQADVKKAFRRLARESHPDRHPGDTAAERRFKEINEANEVLSDPQKRKLYDQLGANWETYARAGASGPAGGPTGFPGGIRYEFHSTGDADFSDFFNAFFGGAAEGYQATGGSGRRSTADRGPGFEDILAGMGLGGSGLGGSGRGRAGSGQTRSAAPVEAEAQVSLEEAFHGTTRLVDVDGRRLEVTLPRGVATGSRVRLKGLAGNGRDLIVVVRVTPHPAFTRRGNDLERELPISLEQALLGGEVTVPTLKGRVVLTIPAGTQNGRRFRLTGQGMPALKGGATGDLYVRTRVILPTGLSEEARQAARRFLDLVDQPRPAAAAGRPEGTSR